VRIESVQKGASGTATIAVGGSSFLLSLELLGSLGLDPGSILPGRELDEDELSLVQLAAEEREAEKRGLALLARAEQSCFMLRVKLEAREFSRRAVALALDRLISAGYLDDRRFASAYAASRLAHRGSKAEGPTSITAALRDRGIDRAIAADAVAELFGPKARADELAKAAERILKKYGADRDDAKRRLRELGYKSEEINEYFHS
jgi:SOS response regulatory protein OraA/RecX